MVRCGVITWLVWLSSVVTTFSFDDSQADSLNQDGPLVDTDYGTLLGITSADRFNRSYDAFLGVPFAWPPVGERRWKVPDERPESWSGIRNATEFGPHCIQIIAAVYPFIDLSANESEDCLYLNVYVPVSVEDAIARPRPVMLFFYGGGYLIGTAEMYPGQELATDGDVIVVTANYRISVMGFMSTGDAAAPGNNGLWDAKAALEWVNENIPYFGGDNSRITVFGQSAGSGVTGHCMISPLTNNMFQRAIGISSSVNTIVGYTPDPKRNTQFLADLYFCNTTDSYEMVNCLMSIDAKDLDTWGLTYIYLNESRMPNFMPVIDGEFVVQDTRKSFEEGVGGHIDYMMGRCVDDGAGIVMAQFLGAPPLIGPIFNFTRDPNRNNEQIADRLMTLLNFYGTGEELYQILYEHNPDINSTDDETCSMAGSEVTTNLIFQSGAHYDATKHAEASGGGVTYLYQFMYRQTFLTGYPDWVNGSHLDDMYSVLGEPFMKSFRNSLDMPAFSPEDEKVGQHVRAYYTNFAYSGDPNVGPHLVPLTWPQYDPIGDREYMIESVYPWIEQETQELIDEMNWYLYEFWPLLRPAWAVNSTLAGEATDETRGSYGQRIPINEEELESAMETMREVLYESAAYNPDILGDIDARLTSAIESREMHRECFNQQ